MNELADRLSPEEFQEWGEFFEWRNAREEAAHEKARNEAKRRR